jgi:hypothetical protein
MGILYIIFIYFSGSYYVYNSSPALAFRVIPRRLRLLGTLGSAGSHSSPLFPLVPSSGSRGEIIPENIIEIIIISFWFPL